MTETELTQKGYKQTKDNNIWICIKTSKRDNNVTLSLSIYNANKDVKDIRIEARLGEKEHKDTFLVYGEEKEFTFQGIDSSDNLLRIFSLSQQFPQGRTISIIEDTLYEQEIKVHPVAPSKPKEESSIEASHKEAQEAYKNVGRIEQCPHQAEEKRDEIFEVARAIFDMEKNLSTMKADIEKVKGKYEEVKGINWVYQEIKDYPQKIKEDYNTAKTILTNLSQIQESIVKTNKELSEKTASLEKEISSKQRMLTKVTEEIEGKRKLVDVNYLETTRIKREIDEKNTKASDIVSVVSDIEKNLRKKMREINPIIEKAESTLKGKGVEEIKAFYKELEDQTFEEFMQRVSAPNADKTTVSDVVNKMNTILIKIKEIKDIPILKVGEEYKELLESIEDIHESLSKRLPSLEGKIEKPEIKKNIQEYDEYKKTKGKELILAESSGKDVEPVDPEECYRKYVKDKCHEYRKQFIKELESQRKKITDLANTQQREYDEFIRRDLVNVFVSAIDRLKFEKGKKIPPVVENKLKEIFDIIGIEEIPVEIEKTKADARLHMIEETKTGDYEDGTVIGIHFRGIRYKIDEKVIKKPVVVRGEKG